MNPNALPHDKLTTDQREMARLFAALDDQRQQEILRITESLVEDAHQQPEHTTPIRTIATLVDEIDLTASIALDLMGLAAQECDTIQLSRVFSAITAARRYMSEVAGLTQQVRDTEQLVSSGGTI